MKKTLEYLNWKPMWVSHLGCIKGCLDYLDMEVSDAWLYGATGHAFLLNMHEVVCPSGPTAWKSEMLFRLGRNVGYRIDGIFSLRQMPDFDEARKKAWDYLKKNIDDGIPCYGWELGVPEYYVVNGYDDVGYYFSGPMPAPARMPKPWEELATGEIGLIEMYSVERGEALDDRQTVKQALEFALEFSQSPDKWIFPKYRAGLEGYDLWIKALETGVADGFGMAYNTVVWWECRFFAAEFLKEVRERLNDDVSGILIQTIDAYDVVARRLKKVEELYPFFGRKPAHIESEERRMKAAAHLRIAREYEAKGLEQLAELVKVL